VRAWSAITPDTRPTPIEFPIQSGAYGPGMMKRRQVPMRASHSQYAVRPGGECTATGRIVEALLRRWLTRSVRYVSIRRQVWRRGTTLVIHAPPGCALRTDCWTNGRPPRGVAGWTHGTVLDKNRDLQ
jgi:hypothetical protein